ncbi:MAG: hypothetical protein GXO98_02210 [Nitrospirae bacterium]|nr:hypothetical protein [Nitrospirota bacterium]
MKKQLFSNLGVKIASLALALALWFSVSGGKEWLTLVQGKEMELDVPVRVLELPLAPFQVKVEPDTVSLLLTGSREALKGLTAGDIILFVLVEDLKQGEYELRPRVILPEGIEVSRRKPMTVKVVLDNRWAIKGSFPAGFLKKGK